MPGVPSVHDPNYPVFWMSFWVAVYSGFVYSVFTGVFVGLAMLVVQQRVDKARAQRDMERDVALFREKLLTLFRMPRETVIANPETAVPVPSQAIAQLLEQNPVTVWSKNLPRFRTLFSAIEAFRHSHSIFLASARQIHLALRTAVRRRHSDMGLIEANDPASIGYFTGRCLGFSREDVLPWIDRPIQEAEFVELLSDPKLNGLVQPFADDLMALRRDLDSIQAAIR